MAKLSCFNQKNFLTLFELIRCNFKVKNYQRGRTVKGTNKGAEIDKFLSDMQQTKLGYRYLTTMFFDINNSIM